MPILFENFFVCREIWEKNFIVSVGSRLYFGSFVYIRGVCFQNTRVGRGGDDGVHRICVHWPWISFMGSGPTSYLKERHATSLFFFCYIVLLSFILCIFIEKKKKKKQVYASEILPNAVRPLGMTLAGISFWGITFLLSE
jgi:hypothetical protein